jgi:hypothetical protein
MYKQASYFGAKELAAPDVTPEVCWCHRLKSIFAPNLSPFQPPSYDYDQKVVAK